MRSPRPALSLVPFGAGILLDVLVQATGALEAAPEATVELVPPFSEVVRGSARDLWLT